MLQLLMEVKSRGPDLRVKPMKLHRVDTGLPEPTAIIFRSTPTHAGKYYLIVQKQQMFTNS